MTAIWRYHIGPATAEYLRLSHDISATDLIGMGILVGPGPAPGAVFEVVPPAPPKREPAKWLTFNGPILKGGQIVVVDGA